MLRNTRWAIFCLLLGASGTNCLADVKPLSISGQASDALPAYKLHPDDEITVHSLEAKEVADKTFRIDQGCEIKVPLAGVVHVGGLTVREAETELNSVYKKYYVSPDIAVSVTAFHPESISVVGSVGAPGVYQLKGQVRLLEALSAAGGVRGDASTTVIVTRQAGYGLIPHPNARQKLTGESIVELNLKTLMDSQDSSENFLLESHDVISVPAAQLIYVLGHVKKAGGFALAGRPQLSVVQALALAEGADGTAALSRAQILRRDTPAVQRIPINMTKVLAGKDEDLILHPNDVLYIPSSTAKVVTTRTIEAAIQIGTGLAIFAH